VSLSRDADVAVTAKAVVVATVGVTSQCCQPVIPPVSHHVLVPTVVKAVSLALPQHHPASVLSLSILIIKLITLIQEMWSTRNN